MAEIMKMSGATFLRVEDNMFKSFSRQMLYIIDGNYLREWQSRFIIYKLEGNWIKTFHERLVYQFDGTTFKSFYGEILYFVRGEYITSFYLERLYWIRGTLSKTEMAFLILLLHEKIIRP